MNAKPAANLFSSRRRRCAVLELTVLAALVVSLAVNQGASVAAHVIPLAAVPPAPTLHVSDLGQPYQPDGLGWFGLNDSGIAAGYQTVSGVFRSVEWRKGKVSPVGPGLEHSSAIDDAGDIFGGLGCTSSADVCPARLMANGTVVVDNSEAAYADGNNYSSASPSGIAVGFMPRSFISFPPGYSDKAIPGIRFPAAVNNAGHVLGSPDCSGCVGEYLYNGQTATSTGLDGAASSPVGQFPGAHALNNHDYIVGYMGSGETREPAVSHDGKTTPLSVPPGAMASSVTPESINDSNVTVGYVQFSTGPYANQTLAGIWRNGKFATLNSMLPANSPWSLSQAWDVTGTGWIIGEGTVNGGSTDHYFLTQIPGSQKVSGSVLGEACTSVSCGESGLSDQTVLVQGKASDGSAVDQKAVTNSKGEWEVTVPSGNYVAGPSLDGSTIDGRGFDPTQYPESGSFAVGSEPVSGIDFRVCTASADHAVQSERAGPTAARSIPRAGLAREYLYLCQATYSFKVSAGIGQGSFVDPSSLAPYAVNVNGTGYRANNTDSKSDWYGKLPECERFDSVRSNPPAVKWLSYYKGTSSLGSVKVNLTYERQTHDLSATLANRTPGTITRVYRYEKAGRTTECPITRAVVPEVAMQTTSAADRTFTIVVSWELPFLPSGYAPPPNLEKLPGVATNVHKLVDAAAEKVPGFEKLPKAVQAAVVYVVAKTVEEKSLHTIFHHYPSTASIIELIEDSIAVEKATNVAVLLYNAGLYGISAADKAFGYHPMVMVIRGRFYTADCPTDHGTKVATCNDTVMAEDVTTSDFPNYRLSILRSGKGGRVMNVPAQRIPGSVSVSSGPDAGPFPGESTNTQTYLGSPPEQIALWKAMKTVGPSADDYTAGAALSGFSGRTKPPACTIGKTEALFITASTDATRCIGFQDGLP